MSRDAAHPYSPDLPGGGAVAIIVPLIIGGALVIAALILWQNYTEKVRLAEMARMEEDVRVKLLQAYRHLRDLDAKNALRITDDIEKQMAVFNWATAMDYADLNVARLLVAGEALLMLDRKANAAEAEDKFSQAINNMIRASGHMWEYGMLGRARTRIQLGKFREAADDLNVLLAGNPSFGTAYYWRSLAKIGLGDYEGAVEDERQARNMYSWPPMRDFMRQGFDADDEL